MASKHLVFIQLGSMNCYLVIDHSFVILHLIVQLGFLYFNIQPKQWNDSCSPLKTNHPKYWRPRRTECPLSCFFFRSLVVVEQGLLEVHLMRVNLQAKSAC